MRIIVNHAAVNKFFFSNASIAYSEQVGINLQAGGKQGEIKRLYALKRQIIAFFRVVCMRNLKFIKVLRYAKFS